MAINYIEKGVGLHDAIAAAGHSLYELDGVWVASDDRTVQELIDTYPLAAAQAEIVTVINAHAKQLRDGILAGVSPGEMAAWSIKRAEALQYQVSKVPVDAPLLATEADVRGVTVEVLAAVVLANATVRLGLEAQISGLAGKHKAAVRAAGTFEEVLGYDWTAGWPG